MIMYLVIIAVIMSVVISVNWIALGWTFLGALTWTSITTAIEFLIIVVLTFFTGQCVPKKFYHECKLYAVSKRELSFYQVIHLRAWKDYVCELGALSGFSKKKIIAPNDPSYIDRFILELNKGMFVHFFCTLGAFLLLAVPLPGFWSITLPIAIVGAILNILPIMVLRYNKPRLLKLKTRLKRNQSKSIDITLATTTQKDTTITEDSVN